MKELWLVSLLHKVGMVFGGESTSVQAPGFGHASPGESESYPTSSKINAK